MTSAMSSSSSLSANSVNTNGLLPSPTFPGRRRTTSLSVHDTSVITTDKIRPDWAQKLASAKAHAARRSAAATALHAAAYLMGNPDGRGFSAFGRRSRMTNSRVMAGEGSSADGGLLSLASLTGIGAATERAGVAGTRGDASSNPHSDQDREDTARSGRRARMEDLEEMMMMEAIRLSLVSEDDRRKKDDKEAKKESKRKEKEQKKAEKAARKGLYSGYSTDSVHSTGERACTGRPISRGEPVMSGKGKNVDRTGYSPASSVNEGPSAIPVIRQTTAGDSRSPTRSSEALSTSPHLGVEGYRKSHLRHVSNTSSMDSPFIESTPGPTRNGVSGSSTSLEISSPLRHADDKRASTGAQSAGAETEPL